MNKYNKNIGEDDKARMVYLQIKMCNPLGVKVLDSIQDLFDKLSGLLLAERLLLSQEIKQFSSRDPGTHKYTQ